jgi:LPXTG-motif cell wall-anchored protein
MKIGKYIKYGIFAVVGYVVVSSMGLLDKLPISPTMLIILLVALAGVWFWQKRKKAGGGGEKF